MEASTWLGPGIAWAKSSSEPDPIYVDDYFICGVEEDDMGNTWFPNYHSVSPDFPTEEYGAPIKCGEKLLPIPILLSGHHSQPSLNIAPSGGLANSQFHVASQLP